MHALIVQKGQKLEADLPDPLSVRGQVVRLTPTEYWLLETLIRHLGTVLPHGFLMQRVWGPDSGGNTQILKVFARRLP